MKTVFLCSGQGSQYPGMGKELWEESAAAREVFQIASETLGFDLQTVCASSSEQELAKTEYAQPSVMAVSLAAAAAAKERGILPQAVGGHSLGEYSALCLAGVLSLEDGFRVIRARARAMQKAAEETPGQMTAIIGLPPERIEEICRKIPGYLLPVNYNSPLQTVIAGEEKAMEQAVSVFEKEAKRVVRLKVSAAFHSKLMEPAAAELADALSSIPFSKPAIPIYSNLNGNRFEPNACWSELLCRHMTSPVLFTKELRSLREDGYTAFVELGPGKAVTGMVRKTLHGAVACNVENSATLAAAEEKLLTKGEL